MKTNHGSGEVLLIKNKLKITPSEWESIIHQLNVWLGESYGSTSVQMHYTQIKPCVIAEQLLVNEMSPDTSVIDYKFWCFKGNVECCLVIYDRTKNDYKASVFNMEWNNISEKVLNKNHHAYGCKNIDKPKSFDEMVEICQILSKDFPEVRVDLYEVNNKPVFGELTFTTGYGYFTEEFYDYLGQKVVLPTYGFN